MASLRFPSTAAVCCALLLAAGCAPAGSRVRGAVETGAFSTVNGLRGNTSAQLRTVEGLMVEKCPQAGCWFDLRDGTGTLRVDTKNAGFTVLDVPVGTRMRVTGRPAGKGPDVVLHAAGLTY